MHATTPVPEQRQGLSQHRRPKQRRIPLNLAVPLIVALAIIGIIIWRVGAATPTASITTAITRATLSETVSGSGSVQPQRSLDLAFTAAGDIAEVLVATGDQVSTGQALARLDTRDLELQLAQAEASLKSAEARLAAAQGEGATPLELQQAQLALQSAEIQLSKITGGNATAADIRSAQANLDSARARLNALTNPAADTQSTAETRLAQAEATLQSTRDTSSVSKTRAELDMEKAVTALTQAQSRYATAKQNWEFVHVTSQDPTSPTRIDASGNTVPNKVSDSQRQQYYDTFVQAEAALRNAEASLEQARIAYDAARQKEALDVAQAEQSLRDAQVQYDALTNPAAEELTQARAAVIQAQAQLEKLTGSGTTLDVTSAQIQVEQARLTLEKLTAPASAADRAAAEAAMVQARVQYENANTALEDATLKAPFAGVVASVNIAAGERAGSGAAVITLVDLSGYFIEMNLSETDVARVAVDQPVTLLFDALPDVTAAGQVDSVAPIATVQQNVVTYLVRIGFEPRAAPVKVGMSATGDILIEQRADVLTAPSRAIQTQAGVQFIQVRAAPNQALVDVAVLTGLSSNGLTEIVSCVDTGNLCLQEGDTIVIPGTSSATQRTTIRNGGFFLGGDGSPPGGR